MIADAMQEAANVMLGDLARERLEVRLAWGANEFDMPIIRRVVNRNPAWYRELCALHPKDRGRWLRQRAAAAGRQVSPTYGRRRRKAKYTDSLIVRSMVQEALEAMAEGQMPPGVYGERLLPFVARLAVDLQQQAIDDPGDDYSKPPAGAPAEIYL